MQKPKFYERVLRREKPFVIERASIRKKSKDQKRKGRQMIDEKIRIAVRGVYDIQKLRISMGNRVVANFRAKLGIAPSVKAEKTDNKILKRVKGDYKRITDGIVKKTPYKLPTPRQFKPYGVISEYVDLVLMHQYVSVLYVEERAFKALEFLLGKVPVWTRYLVHVKGVGRAMAGVIISEIRIDKANYVSSLWKYAGLDVAPDGAGRSRRREHLVKVDYVNKKGEAAEKDSITFNPFLKSKLVKVLGDSFLRSKGEYYDIYTQYRNRLEHHKVHKDKEKGHKHMMARRYMIKMFLKDLYSNWRPIEGLPVHDDYATGKLGYNHKRGEE